MSGFPFMLHRNSPYYDNDFSLGTTPNHLHHQRPHREIPSQNMDGSTLPLSLQSRFGDLQLGCCAEKKQKRISPFGKDGFQVSMDVSQYKPNQLNVKVTNNLIVIEGGKGEKREDDGPVFIQRYFVRRYALPQGYDADKVISTLSSDGVLTVSAPKPQVENKSNERIIQIQQTGTPHLKIQQNLQGKVGDSNGTNAAGEEKN